MKNKLNIWTAIVKLLKCVVKTNMLKNVNIFYFLIAGIDLFLIYFRRVGTANYFVKCIHSINFGINLILINF